ncbi:MAG: hypothetical protein IPP14_08290 [Planctomycetes bacterium]|nr:hypothetical protein [Planctomycetota bacterium]
MDTASENPSLESAAIAFFGQQLVEQVRDLPILLMQNLVTGKSNAPSARVYAKRFARLVKEDRAATLELVQDAIDQTIHHLLAWLDFEQRVKVMVSVESVAIDLKLAVENRGSLGLAAEYVTKEGWAGRFSRYAVRQ